MPGGAGGRASVGRTIGKIGNPFTIAKIANRPLLIGNLGNPFDHCQDCPKIGEKTGKERAR